MVSRCRYAILFATEPTKILQDQFLKHRNSVKKNIKFYLNFSSYFHRSFYLLNLMKSQIEKSLCENVYNITMTSNNIYVSIVGTVFVMGFSKVISSGLSSPWNFKRSLEVFSKIKLKLCASKFCLPNWVSSILDGVILYFRSL